MANEVQRELIVYALRSIAMSDRSHYEHHEKRPRDGKDPDECGGTIWLTPRETALGMLRAMGEETASLYWPFKVQAQPSGDTGELPGRGR